MNTLYSQISIEDAYLEHEARIMDDFPHANPYSIWHCDFIHSLQAEQKSPLGHLDPFPFVMHLYDAKYTAQEAAEIFVRADVERHARQIEASEEEILSQFSKPLTGHDFLYHRDDIGLAIVNHRGGMKSAGTTTPEYRYADIYIKHYYPDAQWIASRADLHEIANERYAKYMEVPYKQPFALSWSMPTPVFGSLRNLPGHDYFATEYEMEQAIFPLMQKKATEITRYKYSAILQRYIEMEAPHD